MIWQITSESSGVVFALLGALLSVLIAIYLGIEELKKIRKRLGLIERTLNQASELGHHISHKETSSR